MSFRIGRDRDEHLDTVGVQCAFPDNDPGGDILLTLKALSYQHCGPIDLEVADGHCVGVYGESGCGKSLMLRAISDLDEHQGEVWLDQQSAADIDAPHWRRQVALLSAESQWWFDSVGEHFSRLDLQVAEQLGFRGDVSHWQVSRLSSGEKQRLALLRILQQAPKVLLLDEPTANLDRENTRMVEHLVTDYIHKHRACALWVSHDVQQLERVCNDIYQLREGRLVKQS